MYKELVESILKDVGGVQNVSGASHGLTPSPSRPS